MTQLQGFFEKNFTLSPDYCGASARMSPLAAFTMFQAIGRRTRRAHRRRRCSHGPGVVPSG